ncbi:hypothetical protein N7510_011285 [Penicillium lagena]|uniref:uncharacterized protein n=1 Tax=Penicillium lagena TaxID=94218 RepID=UPI0025405DAB|nr:uncharacterized protein N7510_011285 [Penicillium lagena]KAJ5601751.1 hypothetical protein N7510_011285 [Penicillium lagena]
MSSQEKAVRQNPTPVYVRGLELRVKELEQQLSSLLTPSNEPANSSCLWNDVDITLQGCSWDSENQSIYTTQQPHVSDPVEVLNAIPGSSPNGGTSGPRRDSLVEELRILSLEAAAERYLGPSSGINLAKLTQAVLLQLSPDQEVFVFEDGINNNQQQSSVPDSGRSLELDPVFGDMGFSLTSPLPLNALIGNQTIESYDDSINLAMLDASHINDILEFYFAHSHTLYPIIKQKEFTSVLWRVYADPLDPQAQSPLWQFRIWIVLAIGSTSYYSVSLMDESESVQFFNKAMTYFEEAMGCGDLAGLEVLTLQVSYSFFNKIGPNTWFLVGVAARMATGMGLHSAEVYQSLPVAVAEHQKRLFFSLYMMDRVVSLALGRPFAIQDDDISVQPFADVDDENINPNDMMPSGSLEPSAMAVPLHILALRQIASDIGSQVHSSRYNHHKTPQQKEEIIQSLHKRLVEWRRSMPFPLPDLRSTVPHLCSSWFDFNYYIHVLSLYRPSPILPTLDSAKLKILAEASGMAIQQAINLHRQRRFAYNWLNLVSVFNSVLSLMYTTTTQLDSLSPIPDCPKVLANFELAIELLETFEKKFPSATKIQGMVQTVSKKLRLYTIPSDSF